VAVFRPTLSPMFSAGRSRGRGRPRSQRSRRAPKRFRDDDKDDVMDNMDNMDDTDGKDDMDDMEKDDNEGNDGKSKDGKDGESKAQDDSKRSDGDKVGEIPDLEAKLWEKMKAVLPDLLKDISSLKIGSSKSGGKKEQKNPKEDSRKNGGTGNSFRRRDVAPGDFVREDDEHDIDEFYDIQPREESCFQSLVFRAKQVGSISLWCNQVQWRNMRNKRECLALAEALDCFMEEGIDESSAGLEIMSRRLVGVQLADRSGDWSLCEAVQGPSLLDSVLSRKHFSSVLKDAASIRRMQEKSRQRRFQSYPDRFSARQTDNLQTIKQSDNGRPLLRGGARRR